MDAVGNTIKYVCDDFTRPTAITARLGRTTSYQYDTADNLTQKFHHLRRIKCL